MARLSREVATMVLNMEILTEYEKFKKKNELIYCSSKQEYIDSTTITATWSTTKKYSKYEPEKVIKDYADFVNDNGGEWVVSKVTNQEHTTIVEFSTIRTFSIDPFTEYDVEKDEEEEK